MHLKTIESQDYNFKGNFNKKEAVSKVQFCQSELACLPDRQVEDLQFRINSHFDRVYPEFIEGLSLTLKITFETASSILNYKEVSISFPFVLANDWFILFNELKLIAISHCVFALSLSFFPL